MKVFPGNNRSSLKNETKSSVCPYRTTLLWAGIVSTFLLTPPILAGDKADDAGNFLRTAFTQQWGTTAGDVTTGIAIDSEENTYVVGYTSGDLEAGQHVCGQDIFLSKHDNNGTLLWTHQWGSCGNDRAQAVAIAPNGNVYVAGYANGLLPGGSYIANSDAFISVFDADGNWQGTEEFGTDGQDQVRSITVDAYDDIYVAGWTDRSIHGQPYAGLNDAFVSKFDSTLALKWTTQMGSANYDWVNGVAVDAARNVYVTGFSGGSINNAPHIGGNDVFITKLDINGNPVWTKIRGDMWQDNGAAITVDNQNGVYVTGTVSNGTPRVRHPFILKVNAGNGAAVWTQALTSDADALAFDVELGQAGQVYIAGYTLGTFAPNTNEGSADIYLSRFDASTGANAWTVQWGTTEGDAVGAMAVGPNDVLYLAGWTLGPLGGTVNQGDFDAVLIKLLPLPTCAW